MSLPGTYLLWKYQHSKLLQSQQKMVWVEQKFIRYKKKHFVTELSDIGTGLGDNTHVKHQHTFNLPLFETKVMVCVAFVKKKKKEFDSNLASSLLLTYYFPSNYLIFDWKIFA